MDELTQLEQQISSLLAVDEYNDDFPEQLQKLVAARHQQVTLLLRDQKTLSRSKFDDIQTRTQDLKQLLEQNSARIRSKLLTNQKAKKSVAVYQMIRNN